MSRGKTWVTLDIDGEDHKFLIEWIYSPPFYCDYDSEWTISVPFPENTPIEFMEKVWKKTNDLDTDKLMSDADFLHDYETDKWEQFNYETETWEECKTT